MAFTRGPRNNSGGPNAPRLSNGNIDWKRVLIDYLQPIIADQIAPNTNRGLMYILESKGILKKSDYDGLTDHLVKWRQEGEINWDDVADGSGRGIMNDFRDYEDPTTWIESYVNYLKNAGHHYRYLLDTQWRWHGQPNYVMFMVEKHAVAGTVAALIEGHYVKVAYNRGDSGWGYMEKLCRKLEDEQYYIDLQNGIRRKREAIQIFYLGDDDKYGLDMDDLIRRQLEFFGFGEVRLGLLCKIVFERIAVIPSQIEEFGLPVDFQTGKGYEIDALNAFNPQKFKNLLLDHITPYFDLDIHEQLLEENSARLVDQMVRKRVKFLSEHSSKPEPSR